jgi:hypothetical protein
LRVRGEPSDPNVDALEEKLARLKREYDRFLAGQLRGEPSALRLELEREILRLTRYPFPSSESRFRLNTLAHRFRALESQIRNLLEQKDGRKRESSSVAAPGLPPTVLVDRAAVDHPETIQPQLEELHRALVKLMGGRPAPSRETLQERLLESARRLLDQPGKAAVQFTLASGEAGPKLRGEIVPPYPR